MKSPNFENCQIALDNSGKIIKASYSFSAWIGKGKNELIGEKFRTLMSSLDLSWRDLLKKDFHLDDFDLKSLSDTDQSLV